MADRRRYYRTLQTLHKKEYYKRLTVDLPLDVWSEISRRAKALNVGARHLVIQAWKEYQRRHPSDHIFQD